MSTPSFATERIDDLLNPTPGKRRTMSNDDNLIGDDRGSSDRALIIIDVINAMDFDGGEDLRPHAESIVEPIRELKRQFRDAGDPIIYVNDNFRQWRSDFAATIAAVAERDCPGRTIADALRPDPDDYFVLKPKHSGFHFTPLPLLLQSLGVGRLVLTGVAGNICVLFTANDALMHGYEVSVPRDAIASESERSNDWAVDQLSSVFGVDTTPVLGDTPNSAIADETTERDGSAAA